MTEIEAWTVFTQFADQQVHFLYSTMGCIDLILLVSCHVRVLKSEDSSTQVHLSSSLGALQQALASSQSAISTLRPVGLAELASNYVLKQAEVTVTLSAIFIRLYARGWLTAYVMAMLPKLQEIW